MYNRIKIRFYGENIPINNPPLLYDHGYQMYSCFIDVIRSVNPLLAEKIHNGELKRSFLFSNFIINKNYIERFKHFSHFNGKFHLYFSGSKEVINSVIVGLLKKKHLILGKSSKLSLEGIEYEYFQEIPSKFVFLSPIVLREKDGTYLDLFDKRVFEEKIKQGLTRVANSVNVHLDQFDVSLVLSDPLRPKLYNIKGGSVRAWAANSVEDTIVFSGDEKAKLLALYYGIGDRVHMGFGMIGPRYVEK